MLGGPDTLLVIDDTALPKQGTHSVGVARQYCGALGKKANCQSLVSLTLTRDEMPLPLGLRLFLPEEWASDPARRARAGVPEAARASRSKGEIALSELDRLREAGVRFGTVLADAWDWDWVGLGLPRFWFLLVLRGWRWIDSGR